MKRILAFVLVVCLCFSLCACGSNTASQPASGESGNTVPEAKVETSGPAPEGEIQTIAGVYAKNASGIAEGRAITIENVAVGFTDTLPQIVSASNAYLYSTSNGPETLNDSQVYSVISFTVTNTTKAEIDFVDLDDHFIVELNYDNGYLYSTNDESSCFYQSGMEVARISESSCTGEIALPPLATTDIVLYIPCAKLVSTNTDKTLTVSFIADYIGSESFEFIIRGDQGSTDEGRAFAFQNVSVRFMDTLPGSVTSSNAYSFSGNKEDFILNQSQVYAAVDFTITNQTNQEVKLSDVNDNFMVQLVYDNSYVYSTDGDGSCFFQSGSQSAVVASKHSIGSVTLAPLATADVTVYIPCAREVSTQLGKPLTVIFRSTYNGHENYDFTIR